MTAQKLQNEESDLLTAKTWAWLKDVPRIKDSIKKLNDRAVKKGLSGESVKIIHISSPYEKDFKLQYQGGGGTKSKYWAVNIEIQGEIPRIKDFSLIASIKKDSVSKLPMVTHIDQSVEFDKEWLNVEKCDHCKTARRRLNMHLIKNSKSGDMMFVGENCLEDFLPKQTLGGLLSVSQDFVLLLEGLNEYHDFPPERFIIPTYLAVAGAIQLIRKNGYATKNSSTSATASGLPFYLEDHMDDIPSEIRSIANDAIENIEDTLSGVSEGSFKTNLRSAASEVAYNPQYSGLICAFANEVVKKRFGNTILGEENEIKRDSKHQGNVGERISRNFKVVGVHSIPSQYTDHQKAFNLLDDEGNEYSLFTASLGRVVGDEFSATATVKSHKTYRGVNQTILTRLTITMNKTMQGFIYAIEDTPVFVSKRVGEWFEGSLDDIMRSSGVGSLSMLCYGYEQAVADRGGKGTSKHEVYADGCKKTLTVKWEIYEEKGQLFLEERASIK